ncbi:AAA domain-containing protein [Trichoderma chlorosporum]
MNNLKENSPGAQWWQFVLRFDEVSAPPNVDFHQRFPAIQTMLKEGSFQGEHALAVQALTTTHAGKVFITGGPGSGKSSLAANLVQAVTAGPPVVVAALQADGTPQDGSDTQSQDGQNAAADELDNQSQNDGQDASAADPWVKDNTKDRDGSAWNDGQDDSNNANQADAPPGNPVPERNGRVIWTAPQNAQVDDAVRRLTHKLANKTVVRCYPYDEELRAIMEAEHSAPEPHPVEDSMVRSEQQLIRTYNHFRSDRYQDKNPAVDQYSLSSFARRLINEDPEAYPLIREAWRIREQNPLMYSTNRAAYLAEGRRLLALVLDSADVIAATPVAFSYLFNHATEWKPDFIVVDEVGRLHETMAVLLPSRFPHVPTLFVGDSRQFGPMAVAADDKEYKVLFPAQRQFSFLQRVEANGRLDYALTVNHRAHGDVHDWPRNYFYRQEMKIANPRSPVTRGMQDWMIDACKDSDKQDAAPGSNFVFVNVADGHEETMGTSFINQVNARFIVELVARLVTQAAVQSTTQSRTADAAAQPVRGKILIITGYSQQKRLIRRMLDTLSETECPPGMVSVRTIDDSPSHEDDVVICDIVRSEGPGFLREMSRLCVMTTRARVLTVLVGQETVIPLGGAMRDMLDHIKARDSLITTAGWDQFCQYCLSPGHIKENCEERVVCGFCGEEHAGRYCPEAPAASEVLEPVCLDNIRREVFPNITAARSKKSYNMKKYKKAKQAEKASVFTTGRKAEAQKLRNLNQRYKKLLNGPDTDDDADDSIPVISSTANADSKIKSKRPHHRTSRKGKEQAVGTPSPSPEPLPFHPPSHDEKQTKEAEFQHNDDVLAEDALARAQLAKAQAASIFDAAGSSNSSFTVPSWDSMANDAAKDDTPYNDW